MFGNWGMGWGMWFWLIMIIGCGWFFWSWWIPQQRTYRYYYPRENSPLEIVRRRLARGEITIEEFENIKRTIESS